MSNSSSRHDYTMNSAEDSNIPIVNLYINCLIYLKKNCLCIQSLLPQEMFKRVKPVEAK